ncbi:MAG: YkgJ family cysteine cluster protein [Deltaproteobacteria bacterium]|nr:YkgJ family cysteine cluster protein [Deltaproteobacteria bacterium]
MTFKTSNTNNKKSRLESTHPFQFNCSLGVSCFTKCCQDINIVLTPYDVLRIKNGLAISSDEFLDRYTLIIPKENLLIPIVVLHMNETDKKCPFVTDTGCSIYSDRPWPCRMYPLDMNNDGTYRLITNDSHCLGLKEESTKIISSWLEGQEIDPYEEMNEYLSSLTIQLQSNKLGINNPKIQQMVIMALYNLDKFREFVFTSTFLDRLDVDPERIEIIKRDDYELLVFAFDWLKFGLFGKKVFWVKEKPKTE